MKRDVPDRVWICPYVYESLAPRKSIECYRDAEECCPSAHRKECVVHWDGVCDGPASIPPIDEEARPVDGKSWKRGGIDE